MIRHHHERYDGMGYPDRLKGNQIPIGARIIAVADAFDAMTSQRPYNEPLQFDKALKERVSLKGKQFDPDVIDALIRFVKNNHNNLVDRDKVSVIETQEDFFKHQKLNPGGKKGR